MNVICHKYHDYSSLNVYIKYSYINLHHTLNKTVKFCTDANYQRKLLSNV